MVPVAYSYRSLIVRWKTTLMTASGFTLVVAALTVMLAFINGIQTVCATSGEPENVVVLNKGSNDEVISQLDRNVVAQIEATRVDSPQGGIRAIASRELFLVVNRFSEAEQDYFIMQVRGISPSAYDVHTQVRFVDGRPFRAAQSEVVIGRAVQREHRLNIGDTFEMGRKRWRIAGIFESGGSAFESEVWCDITELAGQFRREGFFSGVVLRAPTPSDAERIVETLMSSRRLSVDAQTEPQYYAKQAEGTKFLETAAWVIAWFMGVGAVFGVMNTMFAAIGQRIKDIAVMRIMGFQAYEILISFLLEAILIAMIGGALGTALGYTTNGLTQNTAIGSRQVEFAFRVDETILTLAAVFSFAMGALGGILPAMSAMRIKPLEALR
jgi:putative ABC transport system permease protein